MKCVKEILREKRAATDEHIRQLEREGRAGVRYTAMMPSIVFLVLGTINDAGWLISLIAAVIYFCKNGFHSALDWAVPVDWICVLFGVFYLIHLKMINEKEIATRLQKNLGHGMVVYAGLAGGIIGIAQIIIYGASTELILMSAGGFLNFATGIPIYLSFRKGIVYGVE